ncbi:putative inorganic phosphate cotransporter isoform X3 [Sitodiplosis mosellana]|uniref:putative inorganic phosphate cotransporter isoform X3 n=1 Tax=Sitodiplosis mosellana TaxID=263140 RepID=UPI002444F0CA|nr:putative inorganic phosphate cotransporter isoform X3 [Sitodiplosis mosellana]
MELLYDADAIYGHASIEQPQKPCFYVPQRYVLTFMGFMGLAMAYMMRLSLSVAITQMVPPPIVQLTNLTTSTGEMEIICPYADENYYSEHFNMTAIFDRLYSGDNDVYGWSQEQQGIILSAFFWGYFITQLPGGLLSQRYGGKYVFMLGILFSAICSLLTPCVVRFAESTGLIVLRVFSGLGEGIMYAGLTDLLAAWIPLQERTTLGSLAYGGSTVSHEWAFCVIVLDLPKYMNDVLHFSIQDNGIYSSIPQLIKLIMALVGGAINDWLIAADHCTITNGRKIFVSIASIFTGVFIIAASYAQCDKMLVVAYFTISVAFQGVPGVAINTLDLSPNYAGILMGIGGTVTSITGILVPYMVGVATSNSLLSEWRFVFWITFWLQVLKLFIFSIYGSGDVQSWDSYDADSEVRFILPGDDESDEYLEEKSNDSTSLSSSDSDLLVR